MSYQITESMDDASKQSNLTPQIVLKIDGIDKLYGAVIINKFVRIGDPDLYIDGSWLIGGLKPLENQSPYISYNSGTSTSINQKLDLAKGTGESISSMQVSLIDKNGEITRDLLTPGAQVEDILARRCRIFLGFADTAWPEDYIVIFRGIIDEAKSSPGLVNFNIAHPDTKKRSEIFQKQETTLTADVGLGDTTISVADTTGFLEPYTGANGLIDPAMKLYLKINNEVMQYEALTATQFSLVTRDELATIPATHTTGDSVESLYRLEGNAIDLALKLMFSGNNGPYQEDIDATNFVRIAGSETVANSIFFNEVDIALEYGVVIGDFITTTGATNPANNVTNKEIIGIEQTEDGSYLVVDGASFIEENETAALVNITSQYDTLGTGLEMTGEDVDVEEHQKIKSTFLQSFDYDFYLKESIIGREFLSEQIYNPASAYSLPRKSKASIGYHFPPLPGTDIKGINANNVLNAGKLAIVRTVNKNFYNHIIYKYEYTALQENPTKGLIRRSQTSIDRIPVGNKPLTIEATGIRDVLSASSITEIASERRLKKYRFAAEYIRGIQVNFKIGFNLEVGDIVLFDMTALKVSDIQSGTRAGESRLFQIDNRAINLNTGVVTLSLVDTSFDKDQRFGLISPASFIKSASSKNTFIIQQSFSSPFGVNEYRKWTSYLGAAVKIRTLDFTTAGTGIISAINRNTIILETDLAFVPTAGMIMELDEYDNQIEDVKLIYTFMSDDINDFADGKPPYTMI